ncbi:MAG: HAMP domain-containing sensor histidine kinase [Gallionella sp.]|nr:HAMP domain-containing sensor histidine kinase [Gallionella sp.]
MFNLHTPLHGMQLFLSRLSLQTRFLLIFGASSLFFALTVWFVFNSVAERMVERIGARFAEKQALYDKAHTRQAGAPQSGITNLLIDRNAAIQIYRNTGNIDFSGIAKPADQKHSTDQLLDSPEDRAWVRQSIGQLENGNSPATEKLLYIKGQHYLADSPVATKFVQIKGKPYLASIVALPETGWYDITLLDLSVMLPQHDFLEVALAIGGVSLALMVILLFSLRRLVLRPVAVLTAASERIRQGDYASAPAEKGNGEIGQLAAQFQAMRHAVHKTHSWMEEEINKRTRQLSDAKEMLEVSLQQEKNSRENQANLLSLMAHEIRSPIAVIGNTAQMLNALAQTKQPDWQPRTEKIMGAVLQLALLMNKFLDEDSINMKDNELDLKTGDLNVFCAELAGTLAANHDRPIRYRPYNGDAMLPADWHLIGIAIGNLIDNAIKYSPPGSDIGLRVVQDKENMLCVEVTDQGPGIAPELQQRIFNEKFIRGEHGSKIRGTGLGLYLINWIATSHGGNAEVFSTPGNGSTFRLCLPLRKLA